MRILVYGMQSSGASLFTFWLAQQPGRVGVVDLWNEHPAPELAGLDDVVLKAVVTETYSLETHLRAFRPDVTVLFLRDRKANRSSLDKKDYRDGGGSMDAKFDILDRLTYKFDHVVKYEDFVVGSEKVRSLPFVNEWSCGFYRSKYDVLGYNVERSRWCRDNYLSKWGFGGIRVSVEGKVESVS